MDTLLIFLLSRYFLDIEEKKSKNGFSKLENPSRFCILILNGAQNFKFTGFYKPCSDWLNFIDFSGYKYKIRLVSILRKREDQALISISTILTFSARDKFAFLTLMRKFKIREATRS